MKLASESTKYYTQEEIYEDKKLFVENLGMLLRQTREQIIACELSDEDHVKIIFSGNKKPIDVCIKFDSYIAIIKDVLKVI